MNDTSEDLKTNYFSLKYGFTTKEAIAYIYSESEESKSGDHNDDNVGTDICIEVQLPREQCPTISQNKKNE
jgi:hypothetical protein